VDAEAVLNFLGSLKTTGQSGSEETVLYDEETGKAYRIRVDVEAVPAYLRQSYSSRFGSTSKLYTSWPRRVLNRFRHVSEAA
jgi:hypothetical protein